MDNVSTLIQKFLASNNPVLHFRNKGNNILVRHWTKYPTAHILYMGNAYGDNYPDKLDFAGIFDPISGEIYGGSYDLKYYGETESTPISDLLESITEEASEIMRDYIQRGEYAATKESRICHWDKDNYLKGSLEHDALDHFFADKPVSPINASYYEVSKYDLDKMAFAVANPHKTAHNHAMQQLEEYANYIGFWLWKREVLTERIKELYSTYGRHTIVKEIAAACCANGMETVRLEIVKDGKTMVGKYETRALSPYRGISSYSSYYLDAPSRRELERLFGRYTDIAPEDIQSIKYGKKVLYQKKEQE